MFHGTTSRGEPIINTINTTVGVVGGGQLCRMLGEDSSPLGINLLFMDPTQHAPGYPVAQRQFIGEFNDENTMETLARKSDYLTYEIELTDPDTLEAVHNKTQTPVHPDPSTLRMIQDKFIQNKTMRQNDIPIASFEKVATPEDILSAGTKYGYPLMLKAREGGYDGRGNRSVKNSKEAEEAFQSIQGPKMIEEFIPFDRELAIIGVKGKNETKTYPVTETIHEDEILRKTITPARTDESTKNEAEEQALNVLDTLEGRGVYGIEMFENNGEILINEIAPRPHNSGHWTIEGAYVSQFEQHSRAVTGAPLGTTKLKSPCVLGNILGDINETEDYQLQSVENALSTANVSLHWYGKKNVWNLRKMGHINCVGDELEEMIRTIESLQSEMSFTHE